MSDRVLVVHNGRITGEISGTDVTEERIMWHATGNSGDPQFSCPI